MILCVKVLKVVEEVHLEPQPGEGINVEQGTSQRKKSRRLHKGLQRDKGQISTKRKKQPKTTRTSFQKKLRSCGKIYCLTRISWVKGVLGN